MEGHIIANRYATALCEVVGDTQWDATYEPLEALVVYLDANEDVRNFFESPIMPQEAKERTLTKVVEKISFSEEVKSFLHVLLKRDRFVLLKPITQSLQEIIYLRRNLVVAEINSAKPLDKETEERVVKKLKEMSGRDLKCDFKHDPSLMCGIVAQVGNKIYDFSLQGKVKQLAKELMSYS